jgi:hypothetical protein
MNRLTGSAAFAAILLSVTLAGCGGGGSAATTTAPTAVQGVSTPSSVSVVTAKNAQ